MKFSEIQALFEDVKRRNPKARELSLEQFAKMGAEATGDPEMARVANAGVFENTLRGWNQKLNQGIAAVTPDETLGEVFGNIAEAVGVNRETGVSVGRSLPRQVVNVGAMAIPGVGPALSFGLSAADTYDETGSLWQAGIAGAAPMVVGKAMQVGGNKALASAAAKPFWQKMGVTGGRDVVREVTEEVGGRMLPIGTKVTDKVIEAMPDKVLRYAGAQAAGQATGMGLDVLAQGPDAVFNKDYLFANAVGNLAFLPLDAGDFIGKKVIEGKDYQLPPEAAPVRTESQQRNFEFQSILDGLEGAEKKRMERAAGLDVAAQVLGERKLVDINKSFDDEVSRQRALLESDWEGLKVNEPAIGGMKVEDVLAKPDMIDEALAPASKERLEQFQESVRAAEQLKKLRLQELPKIGKTTDLLGFSMGELRLPEALLQKPVVERTLDDYKAALEGKVSERGQETMFVLHKLIAGEESALLAGPHKEMSEEVKKVLQGKPTKFAEDRSFVSMALWATGKMPEPDKKVEEKVRKKVVKEGKTQGEAVKEINKAQLRRVRGADVKPRKKQEAVTNRVNEMQRVINEAGVAVKKTPEQQAVLDAYLFANGHPDNDGSEDTNRALLSAMAKSWSTYVEPNQRLQNFKNQVAKILENRKKAVERKTQPLGAKENEGAVNPEDEAVVIPEKLDPEDEVVEDSEVQDLVTEAVADNDKTAAMQEKLIMQKMYEYISTKAKVSQAKAKELAQKLNPKDFQKLYGAIEKALEMKKASAEGANDFRVGSQKLMSLDAWADTLLAAQGFDADELAQLKDHFNAIAEMFASPEVRYGHLTELSGDLKKAYGGVNAQLSDSDRASLETAKLMAASGKSAEEIRAVTGWFPGQYDGKLRKEISDTASSFIPYKDYSAKAKKVYGGEVFTSLSLASAADKVKTGNYLKLSDVFQHEALYRAYPEAADLPFFPIGGYSASGSFRVINDQPLITATLVTNKNGELSEASRTTILHELQHYIQQKEGFAKGGSPNNLITVADIQDASKFRDAYNGLKKYKAELASYVKAIAEERAKKSFIGFGGPDKKQISAYEKAITDIENSVNQIWANQKKNLQLDKDSVRTTLLSAINRIDDKLGSGWVMTKREEGLDLLYKSLAGEIEARDVEARADFTDEQRQKTVPYSAENIASEDAVLKFAASMPSTYAAAATRTRDIFFSPTSLKGKPSILQQASLLAHEHSHILFSKARSGAFGPEVQSKVSDFEAWVKTMNPHEAESFVDVLGDVWLGKEWKDLPGVGDVMKNVRNEDGKIDAEEVMANVFGAFAAGMSKPRNPTKFYTMLPRVVRDVFDWVMKQIQGVGKAVEMYGRFGWDGKKVGRARSVAEVFDAVRRGARNAERNLGDLAELANLRGSDVLDKVDMTYAKGKYGSSGKGMEKLSYLFDNVVMRMGSLAATYDGLQEPFVAMKDFSPLNADLTAQAFAALGMGNYSHTGLSVKKDGGWMRIRKSPELHKLASQINVETQMLKKNPVVKNADGSVSFDKSMLSPELKAKMEQFSPEAQRVVAEYFVNRAQGANPIVHGTIVGKEWDKQTDLLHEVLFESKYSEFGGQFEKSKEWAKGIMRSARQGDAAGVKAALDKIADPAARLEIGEYVEAVAAKVNTLKGEYERDPNFGSLRRFQPIKVKWVKNGEVKNMQANTAAEAEKMDAQLRADGWKPQSVRIVDFKARGSEVFDAASRLRVKDMEDRVKMKLNALAIPDEFKLEVEKEIDFVGMLERTENAQSVFSTKANRRFAEGVEDLHVLEQDMLWMSKAIYAANRNALDAKVRVALKNPKLDNYLDAKQTFAQGYENFKTQNHDWLRKLSKANAAYFIGFNIPGHIAELMQPVMTHMAEMRYAGVKSLDALKIMLGASKDLAGFYKRNMKKFAKGEEVHLWDDWSDPQERDMLFKLKHVINANPLNYAFEDAGFEQQKLIEAAEFGKEQTLLDAVKNPATSYANWALKFYGLFTRHNAIMGLLNGYRAYRSMGVKHEDAIAKVGLFEAVVNKSGGKADRQVLPFKNNAVLGHLFYGLQGYTTGWVSQLATYFRHGYRAENYEGFTGNPAAIKNARAAFKTMLLAQLGAAGVMGMPFVGAITTLLEELTGDDIRGEMYEALDSVTNDPLLSQAASHGMSTALAERMGIPADLHGRFAIGGLLGFNAYDGFSATSLLGPTAGAINSMWNLGKTYAQEQDLQKALSAGGPTGLRNLAKALDAELPMRGENALSTALGFNSPQVRKEREFSRIAMKRNEKAARDISLAARRVQDSLSRGSAVTQQSLRAEAMKLVDDEADLIPMMKKIGSKVKLFEEQRVLPKDIREVATPESAAGLSRVAKAMGVRLPASQEVEREQLKAGVSRMMGLPYNMRLQQAQRQDYEAELNPMLTR